MLISSMEITHLQHRYVFKDTLVDCFPLLVQVCYHKTQPSRATVHQTCYFSPPISAGMSAMPPASEDPTETEDCLGPLCFQHISNNSLL